MNKKYEKGDVVWIDVEKARKGDRTRPRLQNSIFNERGAILAEIINRSSGHDYRVKPLYYPKIRLHIFEDWITYPTCEECNSETVFNQKKDK